MELFDTHAHVYDKRFDNDREQVLSDVFAHLKYVVCPSENLETSRKTTDLVNRYPRLYGAVGIHPHETCHATEDSLQELESMARENHKIVAIGEIGLDYHYFYSDKEMQQKWFHRQIELAGKLDLPYCKEDKVQTNLSLSDEEGNDVNGKIVGILLILLVLLMTCIFSTLDNAVTLVHSSGEMDIGQWPRILLAFSGLVAGFVFDFKNRKYMGIIMYCVMVLSTICIAVLRFSGSFLVGLIVFYLSTGFFSVFFTCGFMEISRYMKVPKLWAGMGRAVNNMTAAVIANPVLLLLSSDCDLVTIVLILVLFVAVSIVAVMYTFQKKIFLEELIATVTEEINDEEKLRNFSELFSFTERESEVFDRLVNTEDNNQEIAESLFVSRRTLERHISAIYEKTGVKSRIGLLNLYNK